MKLLVIEDESSLLTSILEYLTEEDFLCEGVSTYGKSLQKVDDFQYDCIILDIKLPDGNGRSQELPGKIKFKIHSISFF
jgi:DNA-binding response OmpR family regulator